MITHSSSRRTTAQIEISTPQERDLLRQLAGQGLSPPLIIFLKAVVKRHKGIRKINIPSGEDSVAAVLLCAGNLSEKGLEIYDELQIFFHGQTMIERWQWWADGGVCLPEKEKIGTLEIGKVKVIGRVVSVVLKVSGGKDAREFVREFDFSNPSSEPSVSMIPHPLLVS